MSDNKFMFVVAFDYKTSRFRLEPVQSWIGDPVYDSEFEQVRGLKTDSEMLTYDGLEDVLQMGLGHINKILDDNSVSLDKGE